MRFSQVLSLSVCAVVLAFPSFSAHAAKDVDKTIAVQLDDIGYKYDVDSDGDYVLQMQLENDRTQLVYVRSSVEKYGHFQIRECWSARKRVGWGKRVAVRVGLGGYRILKKKK